MIYNVYSYCNGKSVVPGEILEKLMPIMDSIRFDAHKTPDKTIRKYIVEAMQQVGWPGPVKLSSDSNISITSLHRKIGACVQFGNIGRMYADLLKLQTLYNKNSIIAAVFIMPNSDPEAKNCARATRLMKELAIYDSVITVPMIIIGVGE